MEFGGEVGADDVFNADARGFKLALLVRPDASKRWWYQDMGGIERTWGTRFGRVGCMEVPREGRPWLDAVA